MFRHSSAPSYSDAFVHQAAGSFTSAAALATVPTQIPHSAAAGCYLDGGNVGSAFPAAFAASSSPPSAYSSSLPSSYYNISSNFTSHSLPLHIQLADTFNGGGAFFSPSSQSLHQLPLPPLSSSPSSSSGDLFEFTSSCPVRRVVSTGDLQGMNGLLPADSCGQDGGGPLSQKVGRYSADERKERVERYRVKRHQRNFTKKITYACRKSLADSRPRVKGRFARNGEAEADERQLSDNSYDYYGYSDRSNHSSETYSCYHGQDNKVVGAAAFVSCRDNGEWWWRAPGGAGVAVVDEAERQRQRQIGFDVDEDLWTTLGDMMSVNLAS